MPSTPSAPATSDGSLTIEAVGPIEITPELGTLEWILATVSLMIVLAFCTSFFRWISLLRQGKRPFGDQPFVPVVSRPRPYWNAVHFVMFYGFVILFSVALTGVAATLGYVDLDELREHASNSNSEFFVLGDNSEIQATSVEQADAEPSEPELVESAPVESAPVESAPVESAPVESDPVAAERANETTAATATDAGGNDVAAPEITVPQLLISSTAMLASTLATLLILRLRRPQVIHREGTETHGHEQPAFGFTPSPSLIRLGLIGAWLILPPTMLMMGAVSALQEYSHPVLDALQPEEAGASPNYGVFAALFFTTAIVTPLVEEFWFRGLLQGGLQRLADAKTDATKWGLIRVRSSLEVLDPSTPKEDGNPYHSPSETTGIDAISESSGNGDSDDDAIADPSTRVDWTPTAIWPMVVASLLFALMHWGQGLAPIPLFLLSLGLGYLYRQTGSLVPPIVVHFILNGFTMTATLLEMLK